MKPIAWIDKNTGKPRMEGFIQTDHDIPLYTHPVKEPMMVLDGNRVYQTVKEQLTDKEILSVFVENYGDDILPNIQASGIEFARAILRKAQEK